MSSFDVVIVGAGPAGLKCAEILGDSKYQVLLLEQNSEIGPKVCAGGLTKKDIKYLNPPKNLIDCQFNSINIHVNNHKVVLKNESSFAYTIDRKKLGNWQLQKLRRYKNIQIETSARVSKITKNYVVVNNKKISYQYLVGADGSLSLVKKYLQIKSEDVGILFQYNIPTTKYREFEFYLNSKLFSAWFAWIFPHKNYVSIGCGSNPNVLSAKQLKINFHKWLKSEQVDLAQAKLESFVIDYHYQGHIFGNIFLVGDAGGFVSGFTGEGIYQALVTGEEIAKTILNSNHQSYKIDNLLKIKIKHNKIMNFLIKCGKFRTVFFYIGVLMLRISYFKQKALKLLG